MHQTKRVFKLNWNQFNKRCGSISGSEQIFGSEGFLQGLELVDPLLGVALADLPQRLVLVSTGLDVFSMEQVVLGLPVLVLGLFQLGTQGLWRGRDSSYGK